MTEQPDEPLLVKKLTIWQPISSGLYDELIGSALGAPIIIGQPYTPEELAEIRYKHEVEWRAVREDYQRTREACAQQPAALAVLDLHKPRDHYGIECEISENDELPTDWPCSTYEAIRDAA